MEKYNPDILNCISNLSSDEVFTTPDITNKILDTLPKEIWSNPDAKFLDPATKSGVFLREICKRLLFGLKDEIPDLESRLYHILNNQIFGIALTELTSLISRRTLYCSKTPTGHWSIFDNSKPGGNIYYKNDSCRWLKNNCVYCGVNIKNRINNKNKINENHCYTFLAKERIPEDIINMKFDVIIGNPPYQIEDGGHGKSAKPLYNLFIEQAIKLNPNYLSMIIPSRWFNGGKGLDKFRENLLKDKRMKIIYDFQDSRDCFEDVDIAGGICFFLWDKNYSGKCEVNSIIKDKKFKSMRSLDEFDVFIRNDIALNIVRKVIKKNTVFLSSEIYPRNPFGIPSNIQGSKKGELKLISSKGDGFTSKDKIKNNLNLISKYKVFISRASYDHAGKANKQGLRRVFGKLILAEPGTVCTDSYLLAGVFTKKSDALNRIKFLRSKFVRFLITCRAQTQTLSQDKFNFIPLEKNKNITDAYLYKKFNLKDDEVDFIENSIMEMPA